METVVESPKAVKKQTGITAKKQMKNENLPDKAAVCQHLDYYKESCSLHLKQKFLYKWLGEQEFFSLVQVGYVKATETH